jgi:predicted extracellular nuclease
MNIKSKYLLLFSIALFCIQTEMAIAQVLSNSRGDIRIMFYNVENYFDTFDDSVTADNEFLPQSEKNWNYYRYKEKTTQLFKTIAAVGELQPPEIICFAEIENKKVLLDLIRKTPLEKFEFEIVHFDSPDHRGIDVGLIYRKDLIIKLDSRKIPVLFSYNSKHTTRDILYFKGLTQKSDTFHLFVNHWPSRRGGKNISQPYRLNAARTLKLNIDSILNINSCANVIITGDFNDEPFDQSLTTGLVAQIKLTSPVCSSLYNLSVILLDVCKCGTYRYRSQWNMLDQFIVSGNLLLSEDGLRTKPEYLHIADFNFLLIEDSKYGGYKPYRTYQGPIYKGGFSDHLPVYLDLFY